MHKVFRIFIIVMMMSFSINSLTAQDIVEERMLLTFIPNVQFAPFYVGIEGGYFADAGFDLTLEHLQEPEVVDLIAAGQANYGIVSGEQVILARTQGRDVVYIYEWFQQYPIGIVYSTADEITSVNDLAGMKVGIPGRFGATYSGLITLLEASEMTEGDIQLEEIGYNAPEVVCLGAIDAAVIYVNNEPLQIRNRAMAGDCGDIENVEVITVSSIADLVSNGLITSAEVVENNPEQVQAIVDGLDLALQASINNPARAYLMSLPYVENLPADEAFVSALETLADEQDAFIATEPDREAVMDSRWAMYETLAEEFDADMLTQFEVLLTTTDLWDADVLGYSDLVSWQTMADALFTLGALEAVPDDLDVAFTNQFVEAES